MENSYQAQVNVIDDPQTVEQFKPSEILQGVREKERADPFCNNIITYLLENKLPPDEKQACEAITWARYMTIEDGLLFHFWTCTSDKRLSKCIKQLVIPLNMQNHALRFTHCDDLSPNHFRSSKSFEKLRLHFFLERYAYRSYAIHTKM